MTDALIDGSNMEISPANTLVRRPGWPKYCSQSFGSDVFKGFTSAILSGSLVRIADTDQKVYSFDPTTKTAVYTKTTTDQSHFQQVGNVLFWSDGAVSKKWDGTNDVVNAGIATPTVQPTITNLNWYDSGAGSQTLHAWVPNATYSNSTGAAKNFYLLAPTGEIQWSVLGDGSTAQSQSSAPNWSAGFGTMGSVTKDGGMTWTNSGPIGTWAANHLYTNSAYSTTNLMSSVCTTGTKSQSGAGIAWTLGSPAPLYPNGVAYFASGGATGNTNKFIVDTLGLTVPSAATVTGVSVAVNRGTNRAGAVQDVTVKLRKATVASGSNKALSGSWPQTVGGTNNLPVNTAKTVYGANNDLWGTTLTPSDVANAGFGVEITANVSDSRNTTVAIVYPVTISVFYKIAASDITGTLYATVIKDSNGNLQRVKTGGTSSGSEPTWSTTIGGTTADGGSLVWENLGTGNQLPCLFSRTYAYGFHSQGAGVTHISTMSPALVVNAPIVGINVPITGYGSDDTQVDRVDLYRTADGGSLLLYDSSTSNVNSSTSWTISDLSLDSDLNFELIGPVADANDPPPTGMTLLAYHMGRMWGVVGNLLYFSAGPDCINGDGNQAWPPANVFTFTGPINGLAPTSQGLVVFTAGDMGIVLGGPQTNTFWVQPLLKSFGIQSSNCLTQDGDDVLIYTSSRQLFAISPQGKNELGFSVAPTLASTFNPTTAYLTLHRAGQDQGLFICDNSTKVQRYNINAESWDPQATVSAIGPVASIDTAIGTRSLISSTGAFIVVRDPATFQDSGASYTGYATIGSLVLQEPGEGVGLSRNGVPIESFLITSASVGTALTVSALPNEISGSFTSIPLQASDPPQLTASSTINMKRYDWQGNQAALPNYVKHVQIKVTLPTEAAKNEVYTLSLIPRLG